MDNGLEREYVHAFINPGRRPGRREYGHLVEFTNGAVGNLSYTSMAPEWREEFTFYGTEGVMRFGASEPLYVHRKGDDIRLPQTPGRGKPPADNFIEAILGEVKYRPRPSAACGWCS